MFPVLFNLMPRLRTLLVVLAWGVSLAAMAQPPDATLGRRIERLIRELDDPQFTNRQAAMKELIEIGPACEAALRRAEAESSSREVRQRAAVVLREFWQRHVPSEIRTLAGQHRAFVNCAVFSPDGELLASVGEDGLVVLWQWKTGTVVRTMRRHVGGVLLAAFSPDGKTLATGGRDGKAVLHNVATGELRATLQDHKGAVSAVLYSHDGQFLVTGADDKAVHVRDRHGTLLHALAWHQQPVIALAISADGKTLVSAGGQWGEPTRLGEIRAWDLETRRERWVARGQFGGIWSVAISPDGKQLVSAGLDGTVRVWDVATGQAGPVLKGHTDRVIWVAFSPHRPLLASASYDGTVRLWDTAHWRETVFFQAHAAQVQRLSFAPRDNVLATSGNDQVIKIWRIPE